MFRRLFLSIEYQDSGDSREVVDAFAAEYGLRDGRQVAEMEDFEEFGCWRMRRYPVGRSRNRAETLCDEICRYLHECTSLGWIVRVYPPMPGWQRSVRDWFSLLHWTLAHPDDPERTHNVRLLKWKLWCLRHRLAPFERCECGKFTRVFWRVRDPHYDRAGKWIGPDCGLPF